MIKRLIRFFLRRSEPSLYQKCLAVHIQSASVSSALQ
jgi:hypothetical protein